MHDLRFAILVASGLVCAVLAVGALAAPLLGWSQWPDARTPEHVQVVRLGEPSPVRSHRPARRVVQAVSPPPIRRIGDGPPQLASSSTMTRPRARRAGYRTTTRSSPMRPSHAP